MSASIKVKETQELLDLVLDGVSVAVDSAADGKVDLTDLPLLLKLIPDLGPALDKVGSIPGELAHLSAEDAAELALHVSEKLVISDTHARKVIDAVLKLLVAGVALLSVLSEPSQAPVAAPVA